MPDRPAIGASVRLADGAAHLFPDVDTYRELPGGALVLTQKGREIARVDTGRWVSVALILGADPAAAPDEVDPAEALRTAREGLAAAVAALVAAEQALAATHTP